MIIFIAIEYRIILPIQSAIVYLTYYDTVHGKMHMSVHTSFHITLTTGSIVLLESVTDYYVAIAAIAMHIMVIIQQTIMQDCN